MELFSYLSQFVAKGRQLIKPLHKVYQKDIAELLGISQQYYSEYESGNRTISITHLITLAKYYNTSIDYIVGLTDDKNNSKQNKKNKEK